MTLRIENITEEHAAKCDGWVVNIDHNQEKEERRRALTLRKQLGMERNEFKTKVEALAYAAQLDAALPGFKWHVTVFLNL